MDSIIVIAPISSGILIVESILADYPRYTPIIFFHGKKDLFFQETRVVNICNINIFDSSEMIKKIKDLKLTGVKLKAIIPGFEYFVPLAAKLNQYFGLYGLNYPSSIQLTNKIKMKKVLKGSGINLPLWFSGQLNELPAIVQKEAIQFPLVVKPSNLSGSIGVKKIDSMNDLQYYIKDIEEHPLKDLTISSEKFIIEDFLDGEEYSVEGYIGKNNKVEIISITQKQLGPWPYFIEMGHIVGAEHNSQLENDINTFAKTAIKALNVNIGPFHMEFRKVKNKLYFIEIGARLPGDQIVEIIEISKNINMAKIMIDAYLGKEIQYTKIEHFKTVGVYFINGQAGTSVKALNKPSILKHHSKYWLKGKLELKEGTIIKHSKDFSSRVASFILKGGQVEKMNEVAHQIRVHYEQA